MSEDGKPYPVKIGTTAGTACEGNDSRLSNARTPTSHTHSTSDITGLGTLATQNGTFSGSSSGTNTGDVSLAGTPDYITISGQVITRGAVDLATDITGDLPLANLAQAGSASKLLGRGDSGAGDYQEITLGSGLTMTGTTLAASGGGGGTTNDVMPTARVATIAALPACTYANGSSGVGATLTGNSNGSITQDGVTLVANDLILVKDQASGLQNGLYVVTQVGTAGTPFILTRHTSNDTTGEFVNKIFPLSSEGTRLGRAWFICTNTTAPTVGTTAITFDYVFGVTQGRSSTYDIRAADEGAIAGNARGNFSVDLQTSRSIAAHVASGANSAVLGGTGNRASGTSSVAVGDNVEATNSYATAIGGSANTASGTASICLGGSNSTASADYGTTIGYQASATFYGQTALASGGFTGAGSAQGSHATLRGTTTDATPTEIFLNGSNQRMSIPTDTSWSFLIQVIARRTDADNETNTYLRFGAIDNNAGTTALAGTVQSLSTVEEQAAWDVTITADDTNDSLKISVTGAASKTIRWVAFVTLVQVTG